jgi:hypothetical protein
MRLFKDILFWFVISFLISFVWGGVVTIAERGSYRDATDGCVYRSYASFVSPGYVLACELFRARFEKHSVLDVFKETKP